MRNTRLSLFLYNKEFNFTFIYDKTYKPEKTINLNLTIKFFILFMNILT